MYVGLARWRWNTDDPEQPSWIGPSGCMACLDLRSLPGQAIAGGLGGWGLFGFAIDPSLIPGVVLLGDDPQQLLGPVRRNAFQTALGGVTLDAPRLGGAIWEALTRKADPTGAARLKPIIPELHNRATLHFSAFTEQMPFDLADQDHGTAVLAVLREDYRAIRAAGGPYRKFCGALIRKYRTTNYRQFQPSDLPDEEPIAPTTTITDNFDRASADALGTSSEGWSWAEVVGDTDIVTNEAKFQTDNGTASNRAQTDLSSADHYSQAIVRRSGSAYPGPCARFSASATTFYHARLLAGANDNRVVKYVTGTETKLGSANEGAEANTTNFTFKLEVSGSTLKAYKDGSLTTTITDSAITGNLRCGIHSFNGSGATSFANNFEAADVVAAAAGARRRNLLGVGS